MKTIPSVFDVAAYILQQKGSMTTWKLQKLVYYCQAWSVVWDGSALFSEEIQAWSFEAVVPALYAKYQGIYSIDSDFFQEGDSNVLNKNQRETIDAVLDFYNDKDEEWLENLTRTENPWKKARIGIASGERGNAPITKESLAEYYSSLGPDDKAKEVK